MNSTITAEEKLDIELVIRGMYLSDGIGTRESACSIAAINLALSNELTDEIPECMSDVVGNWIIHIQDNMPSTLRNSKKWKALLPEAAGTGKCNEEKRVQLLLDLTWDVMGHLQPIAYKHGIPGMWHQMLQEKTSESVHFVKTVLCTINEMLSVKSIVDRYALSAACSACKCLENVVGCNPSKHFISLAQHAAWVSSSVADALFWLETANLPNIEDFKETHLYRHSDSDGSNKAWEKFDPCGMLEKLIYLP